MEENNIISEQEHEKSLKTKNVDMTMAVLGIIVMLLSISLIFSPILSQENVLSAYKEKLFDSINLDNKSEKKVERTLEYIEDISDDDDNINIITEINFLKACIKYHNAINTERYNNDMVDNIYFIICSVLIIILQIILVIWLLIHLIESLVKIIKKKKLHMISCYVGKILYILIPLILVIKTQDIVYIGYQVSTLGTMYTIVLISILVYIFVTAVIKALYYSDEYKYVVERLLNVIVISMFEVCVLAGMLLSKNGIMTSTYSVATVMYGEYYYDVEELKDEEDKENDFSLYDSDYSYDDGYVSYEERLAYYVEDYDDYKKSMYVDVVGNIFMRIALIGALSIIIKMYREIIKEKNKKYILFSIVESLLFLIAFLFVNIGHQMLIESHTDEYVIYASNGRDVGLVICLVVSILSILVCVLKREFNKRICEK